MVELFGRDIERRKRQSGPTSDTGTSETASAEADSVLASSRKADDDPKLSACATCPANQLNLCRAVNKAPTAGSIDANENVNPPRRAPAQTAPARRMIWHPKDWSEFVPIICGGWAASSIILQNGSRQILSFLLSGDLVSTATLFGVMSGRSVEAITEVTYRKFRRDDIKSLLREDLSLLDKISSAWVDEREQADHLAVDLGRRMADARVGRLILYIEKKLAARGMISGQTMPFPLRQRHIADATGLSSNHVTKVLNRFLKERLINIAARSLTITNMAGLRRAADWP